MACFCTRCGTQNADDAAFCESCGHPLKPRTEIPVSPTPAAGSAKVSKTSSAALLWGSVVGVLLLVVAAVLGVLFYERKPDFSPDELATAIRQHLAATPQVGESHVCIDNLPYQKPEFRVRPDDQATNDWLGLLVEGGLYEPPHDETVDRGNLGVEEQRVYVKTPLGAQSIRDNRLCFAEGIEFVRLDGHVQPTENKPGATSTARFLFRYRNAQAWTQNPRAAQLLPARFGQPEWPLGAQLKRGESDWQVLGLIAASQATQAIRQAETTVAEKRPAGSGFSDWLKKLFGNAAATGNPLLGRWRAEVGGLENLAGVAGILGGEGDLQGKLLLTLEFSADRMRMMGEEVPVTYTVKSDEVIVRPAKSGKSVPGGGDSLSFKIKDRDNIALDLMVVEIPYRRER